MENQTIEKKKAKMAFIISAGVLVNLAGFSLSPVLPAIQNHFRTTSNIDFLVPFILTIAFMGSIVAAPVVGSRNKRSKSRSLKLSRIKRLTSYGFEVAFEIFSFPQR